MSELLVQLLPAALVGALAPLPVTVVITLLMSVRGLTKALAFGLALIGVFVIVGAIALAAAGTGVSDTESGSAVTGTIIAMLGALLLLTAVKQMLRAPDPDAPPPKFMTRLDTMSVGAAAVFGAVIGSSTSSRWGSTSAASRRSSPRTCRARSAGSRWRSCS